MIRVGLTGGIASGKSTVAALLAEQGAETIYADDVAGKVMSPGTEVFGDITAHFGKEIVDDKGEIDRRRLAEIVFNSDNERRLLNNLTHPTIIKLIEKEVENRKNAVLVVVEVPLLVEADLIGMFDKIVVVAASPEQQFNRLTEKGYLEEEAEKRISSQTTDQERFKHADYILMNKGSLHNLKKDVAELYRLLVGES